MRPLFTLFLHDPLLEFFLSFAKIVQPTAHTGMSRCSKLTGKICCKFRHTLKMSGQGMARMGKKSR